MYLYRLEDRFDAKTGKKLESERVLCGVICDFTGEEGEYMEDLGPTFEVDYGSIDPCAGCGEGEYEFAQKHKIDIHGFLIGAPYIFKDGEDNDGKSTMERMLETAKAEGFDRMWFEQLFRWARVRTADRLLSEGKYTKSELGMEDSDDFDDNDED